MATTLKLGELAQKEGTGLMVGVGYEIFIAVIINVFVLGGQLLLKLVAVSV
jgi:hypothetical protein